MNTDRLCRMVTKSGRQCKRNHLKGSLFCWVHMVFGPGYKFSLILALVMLIAGALSSLGITTYYSSKSESSMFRALHVKEDRQLFVPDKIPATVVSGAVIDISAGATFGDADIGPFTYTVTEDGKLLVNGVLRDKDGATVAIVSNSKLLVPLRSQYDVNSDNSAWEVVDSRGQPILQMWVADGVLHVDYIAYVHDFRGLPVFEIAAIGQDYRFIRVEPETEPSRLPNPPIFRYPGYNFPSLRR